VRLTLRQREILETMARHPFDDEGELVYETGVGYLGDDRVSPRTVFALLRICAISLERDSKVGGFERYRINETGRSYVDPGWEKRA
jgi:hypothetical protein